MWFEGDIEPIIEKDEQEFYLNKLKHAEDTGAVFDLMVMDDNVDEYDPFDDAKWKLSE